MTRVKICGIKNIEDARAAYEAGADELGFHVALDGGRSPLTPESAAEMIRMLPGGVSSVVVTSATQPAQLIEIAGKTGARILQLYGDVTVETMREIKQAVPYMELWKVLNVSYESSIAKAKEYKGAADAIALDTLNKETGARGGSGKTHDWNISKKIVESVSIPVVLAGGLTPENVAEAIATVSPAGVDVNSGVSNPDGSKDIEKVRAFIKVAKYT
ncbi:hypothetical protein A3A40_00270 [Candidatus Kaiserbacteria bacterium RIFCSPLOWO2_01_FULL_54_20]|uniref:N-(5'-phosphoribosyl)anthranilate isomerase n=1 Tax=Candidatus Kaiserbacteria bacterium RIFCSPLOWO2_01_FULL_54_20 TaxID=1798513 RepID=A0A1F6EJI9_9BACT|nr:MAG: hypothetical protein A3A40_00270 [Candidatus Kaiserbacteria bacterium RIFCSPLOWO2_01_FULL_54_20]